MYLGFPETLEGTLEIIMWDIHIHLSLQDILSWREVQHFLRQISFLGEESAGIQGFAGVLHLQRLLSGGTAPISWEHSMCGVRAGEQGMHLPFTHISESPQEFPGACLPPRLQGSQWHLLTTSTLLIHHHLV